MSQDQIKSKIDDLHKQFTLEFFKKGSAPFHQLVAPPGYGKTHISIEIVERSISEYGAKNILVLAPAALRNYFAESLQERIDSLPVLAIDGRVFRELEASVSIESNPLDRSMVAVLSIDFAKMDRIADYLHEIDWDLVIIDETHYLTGKRLEFAKLLLGKKRIKRLLLLSMQPYHQIELNIEGLHTTIWEWIAFDTPDLKIAIAEYAFNTDELNVIAHLKEVLHNLPDQNRSKFISSVMSKIASSSLYALEQSLLRQLNQLSANDFSDEIDDQTELITPEEQKAEGLDVHSLTDLLDLLDHVNSDSKFTALRVLIEQCKADGKADHICIVTSYVSTVSYLSSRLLEIGLPIFQITGATPFQEEASIYNSFRNDGGVLLISAINRLKGVDLRYVNSLIIYDLFGSGDTIARNAYTIATRIGDGTICLLSASSRTFPYEQELIDSLTGALI